MKGEISMLIDLLESKDVSLYKLSKEAKIPYTTLSNIKLNKVKTENITCDVLARLSRYFELSMDIMYKQLQLPKRKDFSWFRSEVCHRIKFLGEQKFAVSLVEQDYIAKLWDVEWYAESLYLLATLDIISKKYNAPLCTRYDYHRKQKLKNILYPSDIIIKDKLMPEMKLKEKILQECNPEFLKYNIVEGELDDVV
jgi:transcriptional regulator with XRE-family HTH domain